MIEDVVISERVPDPTTAPVVVAIFEMIASGSTHGDIARKLNAEGVRSQHGRVLTPRRCV